MLEQLADLNPDFSLIAISHGPEPLLLLIMALIVDPILGPLLTRLTPVPHPDRVITVIAQSLERCLNRESRSAATRLIRGL
jgi:cobalamin biosynthesis protein CobD/CbiB